jgi:hypothetical protein
MPKQWEMAQLSRPYQIALAAMAMLALVWFVALRGHSASTNSASSPASASSSQAEKAAAPSSVYHGAAPGVEGLTRAIDKAHGAVATSQQNAKQLEEKSAQASSPTSTGTAAGASPAGVQPASHSSAASQPAKTHRLTTHRPALHKAVPHGASAPVTGPNRPPAMQVSVENELKQGKIVAILFWNQKASVDVEVQRELQLLLAVHRRIQPFAKNKTVQRLLKAFGLELQKKIAVHEARANQVTSFGSITQAVQVYQTPTLLIVNKRGQTTTLTGLTDVYSIEQAIDEARHA